MYANLHAYAGIYSLVSKTVVCYASPSSSPLGNSGPTFPASHPFLAALLYDPDATLSLWPVPADPAIVLPHERRGGTTLDDDLDPLACPCSEFDSFDDSRPLVGIQDPREPARPTSDTRAPPVAPDPDDDEDPPINLSTSAALHAPAQCTCSPRATSSSRPSAALTLRLALDFTLHTIGTPIRRTGTLLASTCPCASPLGLPVHWDGDPVPGTRAGTAACGWAGPGARAALSFAAASADDGAPFAVLVWAIEGRGARGAYTVPIVGKRLAAPRTELSKEECRKLGIGAVEVWAEGDPKKVDAGAEAEAEAEAQAEVKAKRTKGLGGQGKDGESVGGSGGKRARSPVADCQPISKRLRSRA